MAPTTSVPSAGGAAGVAAAALEPSPALRVVRRVAYGTLALVIAAFVLMPVALRFFEPEADVVARTRASDAQIPSPGTS